MFTFYYKNFYAKKIVAKKMKPSSKCPFFSSKQVQNYYKKWYKSEDLMFNIEDVSSNSLGSNISTYRSNKPFINFFPTREFG